MSIRFFQVMSVLVFRFRIWSEISTFKQD